MFNTTTPTFPLPTPPPPLPTPQVQQLLHLMQMPETEDAIRRLRAARVTHLQDPAPSGSPVFPMNCQCKYTAPNGEGWWVGRGRREGGKEGRR